MAGAPWPSGPPASRVPSARASRSEGSGSSSMTVAPSRTKSHLEGRRGQGRDPRPSAHTAPEGGGTRGLIPSPQKRVELLRHGVAHERRRAASEERRQGP